MTARLHRRRVPAIVGAGVAGAGMIVAALIEPRAAAAGWLVGFAFWSQVLLGSLALLLIHRLTAGRWGTVMPPCSAAAAAIPVLFLLIIPVFVGIPTLYPWSATGAAGAAGAADAARPDVLAHYLNTPFFIIRSILAVAGWTALVLLLPRIEGRRGQLFAAIGLVFHCVITSSVAIDWYLSAEAPFTSSSFGASVVITQLVAAMAWAVIFSAGPERDVATGDAGGLLLTFVLGITYVDFMAVLVIWYGDLPREELWFVTRGRMPWPVLAAGTFILASVAPIFSLMLARVRNSRSALRWVAACVLAGLACYDAYLIAPPSGAAALVPSLLALIGIGLGLVALAESAPLGTRRPLGVR